MDAIKDNAIVLVLSLDNCFLDNFFYKLNAPCPSYSHPTVILYEESVAKL